MVRNDSPSTVLYAALKSCGVSNRDAALLLLDASRTFDGRMLRDRIDESSQLSRRIVHTIPGELPIGLFVDFHLSCPQLFKRVVDGLMLSSVGGDEEKALQELSGRLSGDLSRKMVEALEAYDVDPAIYRNMASYIDLVDLDERNRVLLRFMMFAISGCIGNPRIASIFTVNYATDILGVDFHTAQTVVSAAKPADIQADVLLGLVRVVDGRIRAGSNMHVLDPSGTELGLLPKSKHIVADVDADVSRRHAYIWREDGRWLIRDLCSVNGTWLISGATGERIAVDSDLDSSVELHSTDIVCLGATTRFIAMPVLGG